MIVSAMVQWVKKAPASERAKAATMIAEMVLAGEMDASDRHGAHTALMMLLDDPAPTVRLAIARVMAESRDAPPALIHALARDTPTVAATVVARSPLLGDADLIDIVTRDPFEMARIVASRPGIGRNVSAALAANGEEEAVIALLANREAAIASQSLRRIAERFGDNAAIRSGLSARDDLPSDVRHILLVQTSAALAANPLVRQTIGESRAERVTREACQTATLDLMVSVAPADMQTLVDHLRQKGQMSVGLLMGALCLGRLTFFTTAIASLTGKRHDRVRALIVDGRGSPIRALYRTAGLSNSTIEVFLSATQFWREAARNENAAIGTMIADRLLARHENDAAVNRDVAALLMLARNLTYGEQRRIARDEATLAIAAMRAA